MPPSTIINFVSNACSVGKIFVMKQDDKKNSQLNILSKERRVGEHSDENIVYRLHLEIYHMHMFYLT